MQETEEVDGAETFSHNEALKESSKDHVTDEHDKEQTLETVNVEVETVAMTETFSHAETPKEIKVDHGTDEQTEEQSLETETVEAVEAVAPTEILSNIETLKQSSTDPKKDEQDREQTLETDKVEVGFPTSPVPETGLSTSDCIDNSKGAESTDGLDKVCTPSVDNSKSGTDISTNGNVIHTESEIVDSAEGEVWSIDERKSECTTNNPENTFDTNGKENTDAESHVPNQVDVAADESESINNSESKESTSVSLCSTDSFTDGLQSLSGSEPPPELSAAMNSAGDDNPIKVSDRGPEKPAETVKDDEEPEDTEQESFSVSVISPSHDESELQPDRTEKEELSGDLKEPEGLVEPDSPSHDKESDSCDSASLTKNTDALDAEKSLLETVAQAGQLDDAESQTLPCEDQIDGSNGEDSFGTEENNTIIMLNTPDSPKEATETGSFVEPDHSTEESATAEEDPEHKNSQNDLQSETHLCPLEEQLHEPSKDKSEDNDLSQPTLQDSDEEDGEDEEGQSFDFDDMDMDLPKNPKQEEVEQGVEVTSDESNNGSSGLCQSNTESSGNTQDEPVESNDETCTVDGSNQVDALDKESDTVPQDNKNSLAHEEAASENAEHVCEKQKNMPEEEVGVADEPRHITEEGKVLNVGELDAVAEDINQAMSLPVEEGLDAVEHELQGEDLVLPKSADEVATNNEPPQTRKDVKKNSKKGKAKGKEECKMS